jgi:type I restriction enzyme R subunit
LGKRRIRGDLNQARPIDLFEAAGLKRPNISILSDEFLAEVRALPHKNLAVKRLRKLLAGKIKPRSRKNPVQSRSFAEMLERAVRAYPNRAVETAQVIEELIQLAKDMKAAQTRGENLGLNDDEVAFYDALETSDSAVRVLGDNTLPFGHGAGSSAWRPKPAARSIGSSLACRRTASFGD